MSTTSPHVAELLLDFLYEELPAPEARAVEQHLAGCEECRAELGALRRTREMMTRLPMEEVPETGLDSLLSYAGQTAARQAPKSRSKRPPPARWRRFVPALASASALALVGLLALRLSGDAESPAETSFRLNAPTSPAPARESARPSSVPPAPEGAEEALRPSGAPLAGAREPSPSPTPPEAATDTALTKDEAASGEPPAGKRVAPRPPRVAAPPPSSAAPAAKTLPSTQADRRLSAPTERSAQRKHGVAEPQVAAEAAVPPPVTAQAEPERLSSAHALAGAASPDAEAARLRARLTSPGLTAAERADTLLRLCAREQSLGNIEAARAACQAVVEENPGADIARRAEERLQKLQR